MTEDLEATDQKYRAPALEKGLDILELLARAREPMALVDIAQALGRSTSELFRMVQVLEHRGYLAAAQSGSGFVLTSRLFGLGVSRAPTLDLLEEARPVMTRLSRAVGQSCHLAVLSGAEMVVVARIEAPGDLGFSVRVGYRRSLIGPASGMTLYAFQGEDTRRELDNVLEVSVSQAAWRRFLSASEAARESGVVRVESDTVQGIVDISAPILSEGSALAALTMPYVATKRALPISDTAQRLAEAAASISSAMNTRA